MFVKSVPHTRCEGQKNRIFAIFWENFHEKFFFQNNSIWGFFYARNRLRILKNRETTYLTLNQTKNRNSAIFLVDSGSEKRFYNFQCSQSISRIEKLHIVLFWKNFRRKFSRKITKIRFFLAHHILDNCLCDDSLLYLFVFYVIGILTRKGISKTKFFMVSNFTSKNHEKE